MKLRMSESWDFIVNDWIENDWTFGTTELLRVLDEVEVRTDRCLL
jgi:hypothetical protein